LGKARGFNVLDVHWQETNFHFLENEYVYPDLERKEKFSLKIVIFLESGKIFLLCDNVFIAAQKTKRKTGMAAVT
jgi:hypothetical protein